MALIAISVAPLAVIWLAQNVCPRLPLPMGEAVLRSDRHTLQLPLLVTLGFVIGSAPWWWAMVNGGATAVLAELAGARVAEIPTSGLGVIGQRVLSLVLFNLTALFGLRPSWSTDWIALPVGLLIGGLYVLVLWRAAQGAFSRNTPAKTRTRLASLLGGWALVVAAAILTRFGNDPTGRYLIHLYPPLAILTGHWLGNLRRRIAGRSQLAQLGVSAILAVILGFNLCGNIRAMIQNPPGLTTQFDPISHLPHEHDDDLIGFLDRIGADRGYSNSWVAFRLAFLTHERILLAPLLPYKADLSYTYLDDRYPPYSEAAAAADRVVYVTSNLPALDNLLRRRFDALGVAYREESTGPYTIFYDLSRHVTPRDIGPFQDQP
jgi:hypothetical protein